MKQKKTPPPPKKTIPQYRPPSHKHTIILYNYIPISYHVENGSCACREEGRGGGGSQEYVGLPDGHGNLGVLGALLLSWNPGYEGLCFNISWNPGV